VGYSENFLSLAYLGAEASFFFFFGGLFNNATRKEEGKYNE
jgi:hypothetical protein